MKKKSSWLGGFLCLLLLAFFIVWIGPVRAGNDTVRKMAVQGSDSQLRGVWISYEDFAPLGLSRKTEAQYRENAVKFLNTVKGYGVNTVFFHARAFDDATWKSATFHASSYLVDENRAAKKASEAYDYDPLGVFLEETHKQGMEFHAWLNPYRISTKYFYDPGVASSQNRILTAVDELLTYDLDGIHFDDYFYHASKGYCTVENPSDYYSIIAKESESHSLDDSIVVPAKNKRMNVNQIVLAVHKKTAQKGKLFGISPQGNYDNDMVSGADVDTWMTDTQNQYIDYIIPQIYWSNQWGKDGSTTMYSDRLDLFLGKKKNSVKFYVGLALYRTGIGGDNDTIGWTTKDTNLVEQIKELQSKKADGYVYFSAMDFYKNHAAKELANVKTFLGGTSSSAQKTTKTGKKTIRIVSLKAKRGKKKITGKVSVKKTTVKIRVGSAKYKKAKVSGKKFTFTCKKKLKKGTKIKILVKKKNYKKATKTYKVK